MAKRHMAQVHGSEGPKHDPYSYTESTMYVDDKVFTLHYGLDVWASAEECGLLIYRMGYKDTPHDENIVGRWEQDVGLTVHQFDKAYDRIHGRPQSDRCPDCGGRLGSGGGYVGEEVVYCENKKCNYAWFEPVTLAMIQ